MSIRYRLQHASSVETPFEETYVVGVLPRLGESVDVDGVDYEVVHVFHEMVRRNGVLVAELPLVRVK